MDADARKQAGQIINAVKQEITSALTERQELLAKQALDKKLESEKVDVSLPSRPSIQAKMHPLSRTMEEISAIFADMGFVIAEGPEIETDENKDILYTMRYSYMLLCYTPRHGLLLQ